MVKLLRVQLSNIFIVVIKISIINQAARNLMEAVVLTVKASYVASRMFNNHKQVGFIITAIIIIIIILMVDRLESHLTTKSR